MYIYIYIHTHTYILIQKYNNCIPSASLRHCLAKVSWHTFHQLLLNANAIFLKLLKAFPLLSIPVMFGVKLFIHLVAGLRQFGVCCSACSNVSQPQEKATTCGEIWSSALATRKSFVFSYSFDKHLRSILLCASSQFCLLTTWNTRVAGNTLQMSQSSTISRRSVIFQCVGKRD